MVTPTLVTLEYKKSAAEDFSGNRLPMVPNHTLSIDGTYTILQAGWFDKIVVNAGFTGSVVSIG